MHSRTALWAYTGDRIAVRFEYEWHDDSSQWFRFYGNENWAPGQRKRKPAATIKPGRFSYRRADARLAVD